MRELTQVEYEHLGVDNSQTQQPALEHYNRQYPENQIRIHLRKVRLVGGGYRPIGTIIYREELPQQLQEELDLYEQTLSVPFVEGAQINRSS